MDEAKENISVRFPRDLLSAVKQHALLNGLNTSQAIVNLCRIGLNQESSVSIRSISQKINTLEKDMAETKELKQEIVMLQAKVASLEELETKVALKKELANLESRVTGLDKKIEKIESLFEPDLRIEQITLQLSQMNLQPMPEQAAFSIVKGMGSRVSLESFRQNYQRYGFSRRGHLYYHKDKERF